MKLIQRRFLQGGTSFGNKAGGSFPLPGLSLPYPGMSLPFPGMSISHSASIFPTVTPSSMVAQTPSNPADTPSHHEKPVDCAGRVSTTTTKILVQLDVDTVSNDPSFLDVLAKSIISFGEVHFSLCQKSTNGRLLLEPMSSQEQYNVTVTGLDAIATADTVLSNTPHGKTHR